MPPLVALAVVPLALVAGTLLLLVARARALARPLDAELAESAPPEAISADELARLERWERRLRGMVALVATTYLVALAVALSSDVRGAFGPTDALVVLGLACFAGVVVQFSARCPRCAFNLGFQSRLVVPERCERCAVPFRTAQFGDSSPNPETPDDERLVANAENGDS